MQVEGGPDTLVGLRWWHPYVDDRQIGRGLVHGAEESLGVADYRHHVVACLRQQPSNAFAEKDAVFGDHDAHGSSARTTVGPPAGLDTLSRPSTA